MCFKMKYTIAFLTLIIGLSHAKLNIVNQWPGGFQAAIEIKIPNTINNWDLEIKFNKPVINMNVCAKLILI